tara:strand:+ start:3465 stop:4205 length:741 start_codon:yes stop_codon:yes gene_type:complete
MKKVFVTLSDENFLQYVQPLETCVREVGKWDGDFVCITKDSEFVDELPYNPDIHFYKMYLFHEYFKQWDWIFFCDLDVLFFNEIDFDLDNKQKDILYANIDRTEFRGHFNFNNKTHPHLLNQIDSFPSSKAFQTCFMLFNKRLIEENYYNKLLECYKKYYPVRKTDWWDQSVFNLTFFEKWKPLGKMFINDNPVLRDVSWDYEKLKDGYFDKHDYGDITALHFYVKFAPWLKYNLRFYPIWKEYQR